MAAVPSYLSRSSRKPIAQHVPAGFVPPSVTLIRNQRFVSSAVYCASVSCPGSEFAVVPVHVVQVVWSIDSSNVTPNVGVVPVSLPRHTFTIAAD